MMYAWSPDWYHLFRFSTPVRSRQSVSQPRFSPLLFALGDFTRTGIAAKIICLERSVGGSAGPVVRRILRQIRLRIDVRHGGGSSGVSHAGNRAYGLTGIRRHATTDPSTRSTQSTNKDPSILATGSFNRQVVSTSSDCVWTWE